MTQTSDNEPTDLESRANELYWDSDRSVNWIAEELDLSRGALYALLRPLDAGVSCPSCGGELQYANRTARARELLTCPDCGYEEAEEVAREASFAGAEPGGARTGVSREAWGASLLLLATGLALSAALLYALRRRS